VIQKSCKLSLRPNASTEGRVKRRSERTNRSGNRPRRIGFEVPLGGFQARWAVWTVWAFWDVWDVWDVWAFWACVRRKPSPKTLLHHHHHRSNRYRLLASLWVPFCFLFHAVRAEFGSSMQSLHSSFNFQPRTPSLSSVLSPNVLTPPQHVNINNETQMIHRKTYCSEKWRKAKLHPPICSFESVVCFVAQVFKL
jgi:hypothetical protein